MLLVVPTSGNIKHETAIEADLADSAMRLAIYHYLSDFQCSITVGACETGHSLLETEVKFRFSCTMISRVYHKYKNSGKYPNYVSSATIKGL